MRSIYQNNINSHEGCPRAIIQKCPNSMSLDCGRKKKLDENTARNSLISWVTHIRNHVSFEFVMMVRLLYFCTFVLLYFCTVSNVSLVIKHILNQSFRNLLCAVLTCTGLYRIKQEVGRETNNVERRVNNNLQFLSPTFPPFNLPLRMVGRAVWFREWKPAWEYSYIWQRKDKVGERWSQ